MKKDVCRPDKDRNTTKRDMEESVYVHTYMCAHVCGDTTRQDVCHPDKEKLSTTTDDVFILGRRHVLLDDGGGDKSDTSSPFRRCLRMGREKSKGQTTHTKK